MSFKPTFTSSKQSPVGQEPPEIVEPSTSHVPRLINTSGLDKRGGGLGSLNASPRSSIIQAASPTTSVGGLSILGGTADGTGITAGPRTPVVNPTTGRFNRANIGAALKAMQAAMPPLNTMPAGHPNAQRALTQLQQEMTSLAKKVEDLPVGGPGASRDLGLALRDSFAKMKGLADKAGDALLPAAVKYGMKDLDSPSVPQAQADWARLSHAMAGMFQELKRISLTSAAPFAAEAYAIKEHSNLTHAVGIDEPGAITINREGVVAGGTAAGVVSVTGRASKGQLQLRDDDRAFLYIGNHDTGISAAINVLIAAVTGRAGLGFGRRVIADGDTKTALKARSNADADNLSEKLMGNSAGPTMRSLRKTIEQAKNMAGMLLGRQYLQASGVPSYLGDAKLAKGYTTTRLQTWAEGADRLSKKINGDASQGAGPWSQMVSAFYPSIPKIVGEALKGEAEMPGVSPLDKTSPSPAARGRGLVHYNQPYFQGEASLGLKGASTADGNLVMSLGVGGVAKWDRLDVRVNATKVAHEMLDPSTFKDPKQVFRLVDQYDRQLGGNPAADPADMRLYRLVHDQLSGAAAAGGLGAHADFFGNLPPTQFHEAITAPTVGKIETAETLFKDVGKLAAQLAIGGEVLMAEQESTTSHGRFASDLETKQSASFDEINQSIWGGGYPGGKEAALKDTQKFLAESHDALSKAFGLASAHLFVQKRQLTLQEEAAGGLTAGSAQKMLAADTAYNTAREVMDKSFLAINKAHLSDHSSIASQATFQRHHLTASASVAGPGSLSVPGLLNQIVGRVPPIVDNADMNVKLSAQLQVQTAHQQILASRMGQNLELTVTLESGVPLTGEMLNGVIKKAVSKLGKGVKPQDFDFETKDLVPLANQFLNPLRAAGKGATLVVGVRHAQDTQMANGVNLMYLRMFESTTGGASGTVAPTELNDAVGVPAAVTPFAFELARKPSFEVIGADLGYLSMQHGNLTSALDEAKTYLNDTGKTENAIPDQVARAFVADPELANRYLGKADMIPTVLERHMAAIASVQANTVPGANEKVPNEFYTYYAREPFANIRRIANETAHHAPGSSAKGADPAAVPNAMNVVANLNVSAVAWRNLRQQVENLPDVQSRLNFYTTNPNGRNMMETFVKAVGNVTDTWVATIHHADEARKFGFTSSVKPRN